MRDHLFGSVQTVQAIAQAQAPTPDRWPARPLLLEGEPATLGSVRRFIDAVLAEVGKRMTEETFGLCRDDKSLSDFKDREIPCEQWRAIVAKGNAAIDKHRTACLDAPPAAKKVAEQASTKIEVGDTVEVTKEQFTGRQGIVLEMGVGAEAYVKLKYINCGPIVSGLWTVPNLKLVSKASKPQPGKAWHKGPPPHVGVWPASVSEWLNTFRYWDGTQWSYKWLASMSPETIADAKKRTMSPTQRDSMQWYGYQPDEDGFIKWDGGDCPVEPGTRIEVKRRGYRTVFTSVPECLSWRHGRAVFGGDIRRVQGAAMIPAGLAQGHRHAAKS